MKRPLTQLQQKRFTRIILVFVVLGVVWLIFAPKMGFIALYKSKANVAKLEHEKALLVKENEKLQMEIDRIQDDIEYLEKLAREKHNLLKKDEVIFDFSKEKKSSK